MNEAGDEEKQSLIVHRDDLGEHEQVRAAPALQPNFLQHVFTIPKQHGRNDNSEKSWLKHEKV